MKIYYPLSKQDCFDWSSSCVVEDYTPPCELYNVIGRSLYDIKSGTTDCLIGDITDCS